MFWVSAYFPFDKGREVLGVEDELLVVVHLFVGFYDSDIDAGHVDALHVLHGIGFVLGAQHVEVLLQELQRLLLAFILSLHVVKQAQLVAGLCLLLFTVVFFSNLDYFLQVDDGFADIAGVCHVGLSELFIRQNALFIDAPLV